MALALISTMPLYVAIPPSLEIDLDMIVEEVFLPMCMTFDPVSWFCHSPATAIPSKSVLLLCPFRIVHGYSMVVRDPRFQFTRSIYPLSSTIALFVLRLYVLVDQFSTEEYLICEFFHTKTSTRPACKEFLLNLGAEHHSI